MLLNIHSQWLLNYVQRVESLCDCDVFQIIRRACFCFWIKQTILGATCIAVCHTVLTIKTNKNLQFCLKDHFSFLTTRVLFVQFCPSFQSAVIRSYLNVINYSLQITHWKNNYMTSLTSLSNVIYSAFNTCAVEIENKTLCLNRQLAYNLEAFAGHQQRA